VKTLVPGRNAKFPAPTELSHVDFKAITVTTRKLVLVVDDDPSILGAVERLLRVRGFDTEVFNTVEGFLDRANLCGATCLVLDIHLNGMSGIELRRQLTRSGIELPVIFITANDSEPTRKAAMEAGCVAYLSKPFPTKSLMDAIEAALGQSKSIN
jgi:FixJ family two-component response regulator